MDPQYVHRPTQDNTLKIYDIKPLTFTYCNVVIRHLANIPRTVEGLALQPLCTCSSLHKIVLISRL